MRKLGIILVFLMVACAKDSDNLMTVKGSVKNLKKGTLYLQKVVDSIRVSVDSVRLEGSGDFILTDEVASPEIYFVTLDKSPEKTILFFGEAGEITINTKLDRFNFSSDIKGLANQELLEEFNNMRSKFNNKQLDLLKADFEARRDSDSLQMDSITKQMNRLTTNRYLYTTNFALLNYEHEVAPYLALSELFNANIKLLDTINNSLSKPVKNSKYGKQLADYIEQIKANN
ncbi:MAG: thiol:disulfide interchange protein [Flavobacteriales bacterium]|nr:MAG: thiol:disulfide interchange protein [Flavobacteriales bacterium]